MEQGEVVEEEEQQQQQAEGTISPMLGPKPEEEVEKEQLAVMLQVNQQTLVETPQ